MVWRVSKWLCESGTSQVSPFAILPPFVIQTLDLELSRYDLDPITSTAGPMDPMDPIQGIPTWLRCTGAL